MKNLVSVFTDWWFTCSLLVGNVLQEHFMDIKTFYILESELFHQDDSSETLNETKQENATEAPMALHTGRMNRI